MTMKLVSLCALVAAALSASAIEQVYITRSGRDGEMVVSWVTLTAAAADETVLFGSSPSALTRTATGLSEVLTTDMTTPIRIHVATLTGLAANATVYYAPGGGAGATFSFVSSPVRPGGTEYAIFGDLGLEDEYSLASLLAEAASSAFDAVIWAGDFAYNFEVRGERGREEQVQVA